MSFIVTVMGLSGAVMILIAFIINHKRISRRLSYEYTTLTLFGSLLLAIYAFSFFSIIMFCLNAFWFVVAFHYLMKLSHHKRGGE